MIQYVLFFLFSFAVCPSYPGGMKRVFDEDPMGGTFDTSFYFICLDYRVSRIECEKRKEMLIAIHFVIQSLSNHFR